MLPLPFGVPVRGFALGPLCSHHDEGLRVEGEGLNPAAGVAIDGVSRSLTVSGVSLEYKLCSLGRL